jgi:hypothetical protein
MQSRRLRENLPERILARNLAIDELEQIDTPHSERRERHWGARECPFRDSEITTDPMRILAIVHVRDAFESLG